MSEPVSPDVIVYVCANSLPAPRRLPRQWTHDGAHVVVREVPCSGKIDGQYLLHAFEGEARGLCVVACPRGECQLAEGNYRAEVRVRTTQRLLAEVGIQPQRVELLHVDREESPQGLEERVRQAAARIAAMGPSPIRTGREEVSLRP
jgi:coenzyme F420-reducing hydrogenase delta subunit